MDLACGISARAGVPSGASTGSREAVELRDAIRTAMAAKGSFGPCPESRRPSPPAWLGWMPVFQAELDARMIALDGTDNKGRLGANAILGVSMACARAAAEASGLPLYQYLGGPGATRLPVPMMNILNGGCACPRPRGGHSGVHDRPLRRQQLPGGGPLGQRGLSCAAGDPGRPGSHGGGWRRGWLAPHVSSNRKPLEPSWPPSRRLGFGLGLTWGSQWTPPPVSSSTTAGTT